MRGAAQRFARRLWAGERPILGLVFTVLLTPLSWMWRSVTWLRSAYYDRTGGTAVGGLAVVSVGNLAVGGTGKTPVASWLAQRCAGAGASPVVLLGDYARDEVLLHRRWAPSIPVISDRDRVVGARTALTAGADVVIVDDGFQHRRLARDLDLVLLAAEERFPGRILPLGPYREPPEALDRADAVVITRRTAAVEASRRLAAAVEALAPDTLVAAACLQGGAWVDLAGQPVSAPGEDVLAVAAVGRPTLFAETVRALVPGSVELAAYADHHDFSTGDVATVRRRARQRTIVVTEKDAVKLVDHGPRLGDVRVLAQELTWDWGEAELLRLVQVVIRKNAQ